MVRNKKGDYQIEYEFYFRVVSLCVSWVLTIYSKMADVPDSGSSENLTESASPSTDSENDDSSPPPPPPKKVNYFFYLSIIMCMFFLFFVPERFLSLFHYKWFSSYRMHNIIVSSNIALICVGFFVFVKILLNNCNILSSLNILFIYFFWKNCHKDSLIFFLVPNQSDDS